MAKTNTPEAPAATVAPAVVDAIDTALTTTAEPAAEPAAEAPKPGKVRRTVDQMITDACRPVSDEFTVTEKLSELALVSKTVNDARTRAKKQYEEATAQIVKLNRELGDVAKQLAAMSDADTEAKNEIAASL